jgi:hypothetical protein
VKDCHINIFFSSEADVGYIVDIPDLEACSAFEDLEKCQTPFVALSRFLAGRIRGAYCAGGPDRGA